MTTNHFVSIWVKQLVTFYCVKSIFKRCISSYTCFPNNIESKGKRSYHFLTTLIFYTCFACTYSDIKWKIFIFNLQAVYVYKPLYEYKIVNRTSSLQININFNVLNPFSPLWEPIDECKTQYFPTGCWQSNTLITRTRECTSHVVHPIFAAESSWIDAIGLRGRQTMFCLTRQMFACHGTCIKLTTGSPRLMSLSTALSAEANWFPWTLTISDEIILILCLPDLDIRTHLGKRERKCYNNLSYNWWFWVFWKKTNCKVCM